MEAIAQKSNAKLVHFLRLLAAGDDGRHPRRVQMAVMPAISVHAHVESGAVKMLAVTTAKRSPLLPNVPT